jgi:hypothetical protein
MHQLARSKKRKEGGKGVFLSCLVKVELLLYELSITLTKKKEKKDLYTSSTKDLSAFLFSFFFLALPKSPLPSLIKFKERIWCRELEM